MSIAYPKYFAELGAITDEVRWLLVACQPDDAAQLSARVDHACRPTDEHQPLRIAFIGEWNAGKSSLIAALTGANVAIDADVCTDALAEFSWNGLTMIDTPGIQAQAQATDHDRISREATIGADLVLFVITTELFNPRLAAHLRFVLDDQGLGLAQKTALVVNKMDRESNSEAVLLSEIQAVLGPHQDVPIFFASSRKQLQANSAPPELRQRFLVQSRMGALVEGINRFVEEAGKAGSLTAPLQVLADVVDTLQAELIDSEADRNRIELIRRQRQVLEWLQRSLREIRRTWKQDAYSKVMSHADKAVQQVVETSTGEDLERLFEVTMALAIADVERAHDSVGDAISEALNGARERFEEIGRSPLAEAVVRADASHADRVSVGFDQSRAGGTAYGGRLGKMAMNPIKQGLDAASKNAKGLGQLVYKVGKSLGKKFRPYGAVNAGKSLASAAAKAGKAVPFIAAALDLYIQVREEAAKDAQARHFAGMRLALRNAFAEQARLEANVLEASIDSVSEGPVADALASLNAETCHIAAENERATALSRDIGAVMQRCTHLRTLLVSGVSVVTAPE